MTFQAIALMSGKILFYTKQGLKSRDEYYGQIEQLDPVFHHGQGIFYIFNTSTPNFGWNKVHDT